MNTKTAIQSLWKGLCTIIVNQEVKDPITKRTEFKEVELFIDEPCRLSFQTISSTNSGSSATTIAQKAKLFISSDLNIPPGSKIVVTQNNRTTEYQNSGEPAVYSNHQEITLELFVRWA